MDFLTIVLSGSLSGSWSMLGQMDAQGGAEMLDESYPQRFRTVCQEVAANGWQRVILFGEDLQEGPYSLKACLAQAGVVVLSPSPQDRSWLAVLARETSASGQLQDESLTRLATLLADGMEHGVDAFVVTDAALGWLVRHVLPGAAVLDVTEA